MKSILCSALLACATTVFSSGCKQPERALPAETFPPAQTVSITGISRPRGSEDSHKVVSLFGKTADEIVAVERAEPTERHRDPLQLNLLESSDGKTWTRKPIGRAARASTPIFNPKGEVVWLDESAKFSKEGVVALTQVIRSGGLVGASSTYSMKVRPFAHSETEGFSKFIKEDRTLDVFFENYLSNRKTTVLSTSSKGDWVALMGWGEMGVSLRSDSGKSDLQILPAAAPGVIGIPVYSWSGDDYLVATTGSKNFLSDYAAAIDARYRSRGSLSHAKKVILIVSGSPGGVPKAELIQTEFDGNVSLWGVMGLKDGILLYGSIRAEGGQDRVWVGRLSKDGLRESIFKFDRNAFATAAAEEGDTLYIGGSHGFDQARSGSVSFMKGFLLALDSSLTEKKRFHLDGPRTTRVLTIYPRGGEVWVGGSTDGPDTHSEERHSDAFIQRLKVRD